nr:RNA-directed DNA polymerase [Tanacetum cinerariifolium]
MASQAILMSSPRSGLGSSIRLHAKLPSCGLADHFGRDKNLALLCEQFYWPKMERDVNKLLERCRACHIAKTHSSNAGKSPFEVVYGRNPITPLDLVPVPEVGQFSKEWANQFEQIKELHRSVREQIIRHNEKYKGHADKHRKQVLYREGDLVWIHLRDSDDEPDSGSSLFQEREDDADPYGAGGRVWRWKWSPLVAESGEGFIIKHYGAGGRVWRGKWSPLIAESGEGDG